MAGADPGGAIPVTGTNPLRSRRSTNRVLHPKHPVRLSYPYLLHALVVEQAFGRHPGPMCLAHMRSVVTMFNRGPALVTNRARDVVY